MSARCLTLALLLLPFAAQAQTPPRETLPLGLDRFYWDMEFTEAQKFFGEIGGSIALPYVVSMNHAWDHFAPYSWKGCIISADLYFHYSNLDHIQLSLSDAQKQAPSCSSDILKELRAHYGPGTAAPKGQAPDLRIWQSTGTQVSYRDNDPYAKGISIRLDMTGAEPLASVDVIIVDRNAIEETGADFMRATRETILRNLAPAKP